MGWKPASKQDMEKERVGNVEEAKRRRLLVHGVMADERFGVLVNVQETKLSQRTEDETTEEVGKHGRNIMAEEE